MKIKKLNKNGKRYLPLEDIKKIDDEFLTEIEKVKRRLSYIRDFDLSKNYFDVLLNAYNAAIEVKTLERETDYEIKLAEIKARRQNIAPWRRCCLWRLLFQPLTNRAQDIIEQRAELEADKAFTDEENELDKSSAKIYGENASKLTERKRKRAFKKYRALKQLFEADGEPGNTSDNTPGNPPAPPAEPPEPPTRKPRKNIKTEG